MKFKFDQIAINSTAKKTPVPEDAAHYIGLEHLIPGTFDIPEWGSEVAPVGEKLLMKKGDVLFGRRRAYQRKVGIAPFDGIFSAHGMVLRPRPEVVDEKYFPFFISSDQFMNEAVRISVGSLSPTINWGTLKNCEFDLPPLDEQKKLAELLWAANDLKESYKKAITATDEMLKAKFREMFGDIIHNDKCWPAQKLAKVMRLINGRAYAKHELLSSGKYRVLRVGNFFTNDSWYYSDMELEPDKYCEKGDLLFAWSASFGPRIWDDEKVIYHYHIWKVEHSSELDRKWAFWLLSTIAGNVKGHTHGSTMVHTTKGDMEKRIIPLPPLSLQREFVAIAEKAESAKANLKKSIAAIDQVMKGLINE